MRIAPLDPVSRPDDLAAVARVYAPGYADAVPDEPPPGDSLIRFWCAPGSTSSAVVLAAYEDGEDRPSGALNLTLPVKDNLRLAYGAVWVLPERRRRGVGSALIAEAFRVCAAGGRARIALENPATVDAEPFARAHGGRAVERDTRSALELAAVDREQFGRWAAPAAPNADMTLVEWTDRCPPEYVAAYCRVMDAMRDAPTEDYAFELVDYDEERLRGREKDTADHGLRRHTMAALAPSGAIAGFTTVISAPGGEHTLDVWDTGVAREYRGRGLGLRLKAAMTLWMLREYPAAQRIQTFNNSGNEHMLRVNRVLGYRAREDWITYEFPVPGVTDD